MESGGYEREIELVMEMMLLMVVMVRLGVGVVCFTYGERMCVRWA